MASGPPPLHDLTCAIHVHSTFSDGTGKVPEIVRAGRRAGVDVVLLTDHNTLEARRLGFEGWHGGDVLLLVGEEVTPRGGNHYLAFGVEKEIPWRDTSPGDICAAVSEAGGFGFAAHPFSAGSVRFKRATPMPWRDLECDGLAGIEVWSFVNDNGEAIRSLLEALRFVVAPNRFMVGPPERNLREWDRMNAGGRRVVGIGGLDAHQIGKRILDRWVVRPVGYARSFRQLRTHVLCEEPPTGELEHDREQVYSALRAGRSYIAVDALAPARGFAFWAEGDTLHARVPRPAELRLVGNGREVVRVTGAELEHSAAEPGPHRVEVRLHAHGRDRTWILSNPIHL